MIMELQYIIVALAILAAATFAGRGMLKRKRSFSVENGCGVDCGCGDKSKSASV